MALPQHLRTGLRGEQLAARYLREKGYDIIAANYKTSFGETDIIAIAPDKQQTVCFVEVKTRSPAAINPPSSAVDYKKKKRLISMAGAFLKAEKMNGREYRFDIIEVILHSLYNADINHITNAFDNDRRY